jgi:CBS domain-containing protein
MICPACGFENIQGEDSCENCGADLRTSDIPAPSNSFEARLVAAPLAALRAPQPITTTPDAAIADAVRLMQEASVGCLVVEGEGAVRGILTERDCVLKLSQVGLDGTTVAQIMTPDPVVLRPDDSLAVAINKMAVGGFRHIPLVENGHATGIVSARDLFRYILDTIDSGA